jgi:hypothetical protein
MADNFPAAHSPRVKIELFVAGLTLSVSHVGGGSMIVRRPVDVQPTDAQLVLAVDDRRYEYDVHLAEGISQLSKVVPFQKLDDNVPF